MTLVQILTTLNLSKEDCISCLRDSEFPKIPRIAFNKQLSFFY